MTERQDNYAVQNPGDDEPSQIAAREVSQVELNLKEDRTHLRVLELALNLIEHRRRSVNWFVRMMEDRDYQVSREELNAEIRMLQGSMNTRQRLLDHMVGNPDTAMLEDIHFA